MTEYMEMLVEEYIKVCMQIVANEVAVIMSEDGKEYYYD